MLTGDYEKDKAELERLIAHERAVEEKLDRATYVAVRSRLRYQCMLRDLKLEAGL